MSLSDANNRVLFLPRVLDDFSVVIVPGLHNSDEHHWQSLWQSRLSLSKRIHLDNWDNPDLDAWKNAIKAAISTTTKPVILIAHSFGALASTSIAAEYPEKIAALFLVAPADPDKFGIAQRLPQHFLSADTKIIASSNDPWIAEHKAAYLALLWGADYLRLQNAGHINSNSDLGFWQEGVRELHKLVKSARLKLQGRPHLKQYFA